MRTPEENYEAAALELAAYRLMQREQDDIDTPDDAAAESMPRMLKMIDRQLTKKQRHDRFWKQTVRVLKTAAMVVLVLNMALTIVVASTGKVQVRFLDLVMQVNDSYMDIRYQPTETEATMPEDWKTNYFPSYIPDGYTLAQYVLSKSSTDFLIILAPLRKCRNCLEYQAFPAFCVSEDTPHIMAYRSLIWRSKVVKP